MIPRDTFVCRDYRVTRARGGGWTVRHHRHGPEVTTCTDGRVALVTWPTFGAAIADIDATYELPESPSTPRLRTAA